MALQTLSRVYSSRSVAEEVVRDLEAAGVPHADISLLAAGDNSVNPAAVGGASNYVAESDLAAEGRAGTIPPASPPLGTLDPALTPVGVGPGGVGTAGVAYPDPAYDAPGSRVGDPVPAAPVTTHTEGAAGTGAGTGATLGTILGGGAGLLAGIGALAIPGVGPVVAAGWLIAALTGAGAGAAVGAAGGALAGSLTGAGVSESDARDYERSAAHGGTLVVVRASTEQDVQRAERILHSRPAYAAAV